MRTIAGLRGRSSSAAADTKEPFAWALSNDNSISILGADMDGYFRITLLTPDQMKKCYTDNATGPSRSAAGLNAAEMRLKHG